MKLKALGLALLVAGFGSSYALAKGQPQHPNHGKNKLAVCHKAGKSGRWIKINVASRAVEKAHLKHGDVLPDASGNCPGAATTTTVATTTDSTTTDQTTTDETTTDETTTEQTTTTDTTSTEDSQGDNSQGNDSQGSDSQGDNGQGDGGHGGSDGGSGGSDS